MTRVTVAVRIDDRLEARAREYGDQEGLNLRQVIELALALALDVPPAIAGLDRLGLCPQCEKGVISSGRCDHCNWHTQPRPWKQPGTRTRQTARGRGKRQQTERP